MSILARIAGAFGGDDDPLPVQPPGRNDPCWCGSGRKYKQCHLAADASKRSEVLAASCRIGST